MFVVWLLLMIFAASNPVQAQIPLYYQLFEAYHPVVLRTYSPVIASFVTPTPSPSILGVSVTAPLSIPQNIGGFSPPQPSVGGEGRVTTIAVLGDSMIDTLGKDLPTLKKALNQYFPGSVFNLLNYGVGARDAEYGLYRLTNDYQYRQELISSLVSQNPDIVVVESFAYNNYGNTSDGINRHWLALGAITTTIRQKLPQAKIVIAATIAPNSVYFSNGVKDIYFSAMEKIEKTSTIKVYLQNAVNFATSQGFPLADSYHLSLVGNDGSKDFIDPMDNIHPSFAGATLFGDVVADTIFRNKLLD